METVFMDAAECLKWGIPEEKWLPRFQEFGLEIYGMMGHRIGDGGMSIAVMIFEKAESKKDLNHGTFNKMLTEWYEDDEGGLMEEAVMGESWDYVTVTIIHGS